MSTLRIVSQAWCLALPSMMIAQTTRDTTFKTPSERFYEVGKAGSVQAQQQGPLHVYKLPPGAERAVTVSLTQGIIRVTLDTASKTDDNILFLLPSANVQRPGQAGRYWYFADSAGFHIITTEQVVGSLQEVKVIVPRGLRRLDLKLTGGGSIIVEDFGGDLTVSNQGGSVILEHISGTALVDTRNGEIRAIVDKLPEQKSAGIVLQTNNGNIIATLPDLKKAEFRFSAARGSIFSDYIPGGLVLNNFQKNDDRMDLHPQIMGVPDGGGVPVHLTTINGSIVIIKR